VRVIDKVSHTLTMVKVTNAVSLYIAFGNLP
jgi:hypothetical protein